MSPGDQNEFQENEYRQDINYRWFHRIQSLILFWSIKKKHQKLYNFFYEDKQTHDNQELF